MALDPCPAGAAASGIQIISLCLMHTTLIGFLAGSLMSVISRAGYAGVILLMSIESACVPLPSEVIMPFAGYLASIGRFSLFKVGLAGAVGCNIGSIVAYYVGSIGGRPLVEKYGRYVLLSRHDLELAEQWFERWGDSAVFFARLLPLVRTFIALPAGISRMNFLRFNIYTFLGSLPWCWGLAYAGFKLGQRWEILRGYFHRLDLIFVILVAVGFAWFVRNHWKNRLR
jgi:membrane protein DedA with SNARE-associated domain